jgi:uncharacterized YigZ family protein
MTDFPEPGNQTDSYLTLANQSEGIFKDRGSKFLSFAYPAKSEEMIKSILSGLKKNHFDASHHCYAWVLGTNGNQVRCSDDGEPNHSAGDPILGQIRSHQLTNVLLVVVRYFGGTKLGVSGLIQAYRTSAALAIAENQIIREWVKTNLEIQFPYPAMNEVMKVVKSQEIEITKQEMNLDCSMSLCFRAGSIDAVRSKLKEIEGLQLLSD